jgi:hypothetical protein
MSRDYTKVFLVLFERFGWTPDICYNLTELQIANIIKGLSKQSETTNTDTKRNKLHKKTLNEIVEEKSKKLGRKLTPDEIDQLL